MPLAFDLTGGVMRSTEEPSSPVTLPKETWGETFKRTLLEFREDNLNHWAAALTFYALLSIFPALLVMVALVGVFANPDRVTSVLTQTVSELGPDTAARTFQAPIESITSSRGAAGIMFFVGVVGALWAASAYVAALSAACNDIYEVDEGRPFWKRKPLQLLVTFLVIMMAAFVALGLVLTGPLVAALGHALGVSDTALTLWRFAKWPAMALLVVAIFDLLYYAAPNARITGIRWITGGAVLGLIVWVVASWGFSFYVGHFGSYNKTYGALGGVVVFLLWLWITNMAVLLGAEFNAEVERARQIVSGVPDADRELRMPEREPADGHGPSAAT